MFDAIWRALVRRNEERAIATTELVDELLHSFGTIHRVETQLRAGDHVINDDREFLPLIARATGLGLSIYLANRRIASASVLEAGPARDTGSYADATLVDVVLRKGEVFRGRLEHDGSGILVAGRALYATARRDEQGAVGMIEAYQDERIMFESLAAAARDAAGIEAVAAHEQADQVERTMHFIDDVARRLQLLALNGNIIAAQAGEHGRAFRVVCRELSSLAEQSKEASADVRRLRESMGFEEDEVLERQRTGGRGLSASPPRASRTGNDSG